MTSRRITATAAVQTLTWTAENRLQSVTVGGATKADFDYDADGVRVRADDDRPLTADRRWLWA